jgi:hypothetical protein
MWIVRVALDRPYTFVVLALMILIMSVVAISRTPTDIFPKVITAQTAYLDNERNQVEIRRRRMDATVLLVKALGGGWTAAALPKLSELDHPSNDGRLP